MALFAAAIEERIDARAGAVLLWPLLAFGVFSLLVWRWTGDLRLYGWVQFFPCVALLLLFMLCAPKYTGTFYWIIAAALYAVAKVAKFKDHANPRHRIDLSGHTLEHLAAAARLLCDPALLPDTPADRLIVEAAITMSVLALEVGACPCVAPYSLLFGSNNPIGRRTRCASLIAGAEYSRWVPC